MEWKTETNNYGWQSTVTVHGVPDRKGYRFAHCETVVANGRVFMIRVELTDGNPVGFDSRNCLSMLTDSGWHNIIDCHGLGVESGGPLTTSRDYEDWCSRMRKACCEYIRLIY